MLECNLTLRLLTTVLLHFSLFEITYTPSFGKERHI